MLFVTSTESLPVRQWLRVKTAASLIALVPTTVFSAAVTVSSASAATGDYSGSGLWQTTDFPLIKAAMDTVPVEIGVKFRSSVSGSVSGIGFFKGPGNDGRHVGTLWDSSGRKLTEVNFIRESATGWQFAEFKKPVKLNPGRDYLASYQAPMGRFALNTNYFGLAGSTRGALTASSGVFKYGTKNFPNGSSTSNYWVDVRFNPDPVQPQAPESPTAGQAPITPETPTSSQTPVPKTRDKYQWPFSSTSIWNMPIGAGAQYKSLNLTPPTTGYGLVEVFIKFDANAPLRQLVDRGYWWPYRDGLGVVGTPTGVSVKVPDEWIIPAPPSPAYEDRPSAALQADGRAREFQYTVRPTRGSSISVFERPRATFALDGDGMTPSGQSGAHGGSGLTTIGGTIRKGELSGPEPIRHALAVTMNLTKWGTKQSGNITNGYRWPALWADTLHSSDSFATGYGTLTSLGFTGRDGLGMGSLVALPSSIDLNSIKFETPIGKKLAWTYRNYGAYVVDNAGDTGDYDLHRHNIEKEAVAEAPEIDAGYTTDTPFGRDMNKIFPLLAVVDNNTPKSIGGGGTPRQPMAPPIGN